jgi:hypothetical protein
MAKAICKECKYYLHHDECTYDGVGCYIENQKVFEEEDRVRSIEYLMGVYR